MRRFVTDFRYVEQARAPRSTGFDRERAPQDLLRRARAGWPAGRLRLGFEDHHVSVRAPRAAARGAAGPRRARRRPAGWSRPSARSRSRARSRAIRAAAALVDEALRVAARARARRAGPSATVALALEHEMRALRRAGAELPVDRRRRRARRAPARARRATSRSRAARWSRSTSGRVLDGYCSDCTRTWATGELPRRPRRGLRARAARAGGGAGRGAARAARAARSTPSRAT